MARAQGALPYVVEGYAEVQEAVNRGHAVLLRREACEVADGVRVFDSPAEAATPAAGSALAAAGLEAGDADVITVSAFDVRTARFVVQDAGASVGAVQLTPKRLERYLAQPSRAVGVALG